MLSLSDVEAAWRRIAPHIRRTPVIEAEAGVFGQAEPATLKLELFQHGGSFKPRGAFNNLLSRAVSAAGIAAASGGNHGIAVAHAARALGHKARIFVPEISPKIKVSAIEARGATVIVGGKLYNDARRACEAYVAETGALEVHPFESWETMAGQGTLALEWMEQTPDLDTVLVAVGGGGLIAGMARAFEGRVKVVGVEPEGSRCLHAALEAGRPVEVPVSSIAADSLGANQCGDHVFEVAQRFVDHVALVSDAAIRAAQLALWSAMRITAEPGGAAALAALASGAYKPAKGERVGVLVCGANGTLETFL